MEFEWFIGWRYLKTKKKQTFISLITILSVVGIALGAATLIAVTAVMTGAEYDIKSRLLQFQPHVIFMRHGGALKDQTEIVQYFQKMDGVYSATPFIYTQAMIRSASGISGVVLKGIPPDAFLEYEDNPDISALKEVLSKPKDAGASEVLPGIVLGKELAAELKVAAGDIVYMTFSGSDNASFQMPKMKRVKVLGGFSSGFYEYDKSFGYMHIDDARQLFGMPDTATGVEIRLKDPFIAREISQKIDSLWGFPYWTKDWIESNRNLFSSLKLQKTVMIIILSLIILVAGFSVTSTLFMMVMEKVKDIAILKAMGATRQNIRNIFVIKGMIIGFVGAITGAGLGFLVCELLKRYTFIELPGDVYYFTTLPVRMEPMDVLLILGVTLFICFAGTFYPAYRAASIDPVRGIRLGR